MVGFSGAGSGLGTASCLLGAGAGATAAGGLGVFAVGIAFRVFGFLTLTGLLQLGGAHLRAAREVLGRPLFRAGTGAAATCGVLAVRIALL